MRIPMKLNTDSPAVVQTSSEDHRTYVDTHPNFPMTSPPNICKILGNRRSFTVQKVGGQKNTIYCNNLPCMLRMGKNIYAAKTRV
jgi:hypothetical protein